VLAASGCAGLRRQAEPGDVALYRARVSLRDGGTRAFRLLVFASPPDRLHAEALGPTGAPHLVVDAGSGRIAVAFPGEGVAYVGDADPEALSRIVGIPVTLPAFVAFLTLGEVPPIEGVALRREPAGAGLPREAELSAGSATLSLTRRQWRPAPPDPGALGRGTAAPGLAVRPLSDLPDMGLPALGTGP
jgi:hypothetical protein